MISSLNSHVYWDSLYHKPWRYSINHGGIQETMEIYQKTWRHTRHHGGIPETMEVYQKPWRYTRNHGSLSETMKVNQKTWKYTRNHGSLPETMEAYQKPWRYTKSEIGKDINQYESSMLVILQRKINPACSSCYFHFQQYPVSSNIQ